jgi:hypothetical protein
VAKQYEQFKKTFDDQIKPSFKTHAGTITEWNTADKKHYTDMLEQQTKAKAALAKLKETNLAHSGQFQRDIRAALVDKQLGERDGGKVDLSKQVLAIKTTLQAWEKDQTQYQNAAKAPASAVKTQLADWTHEKDPQSMFDAIIGAHHRKMVSDLETEITKEIADRKKQLSTKLGTGNKSVADMEKLLEAIKKYKLTAEYKSVAEWKFNLATWKAKREAEIGKDILGWEPLDLAKWKATRTKEVKEYLKLNAFDF